MPAKINCAYDELVPIDKLKPHPRNPNRHSLRQVEYLAMLIREHGWRAPITVSNKSGFVVRGHCRLEAAKRLGLESAPVDYQDYPDEHAELADLLADNRIAELSFRDVDLLTDVLGELQLADVDLELAGYNAGALLDLLKLQNLYKSPPHEVSHECIIIPCKPEVYDLFWRVINSYPQEDISDKVAAWLESIVPTMS